MTIGSRSQGKEIKLKPLADGKPVLVSIEPKDASLATDILLCVTVIFYSSIYKRVKGKDKR